MQFFLFSVHHFYACFLYLQICMYGRHVFMGYLGQVNCFNEQQNLKVFFVFSGFFVTIIFCGYRKQRQEKY